MDAQRGAALLAQEAYPAFVACFDLGCHLIQFQLVQFQRPSRSCGADPRRRDLRNEQGPELVHLHLDLGKAPQLDVEIPVDVGDLLGDALKIFQVVRVQDPGGTGKALSSPGAGATSQPSGEVCRGTPNTSAARFGEEHATA
jgi:hypothetical protein